MPFKSMRPPRVYIPNRSYHNFDDAKRFGELVFLTEGNVPKMVLIDLYRSIVPILREADIGDYLLISGPTTVNIVATSIMARRFGRINFLIFDAYTHSYVSKLVVLDNLEVENARTRESVELAARTGLGNAPDRGG